MKYTKQYLIDNKIAIILRSNSENSQIVELLGESIDILDLLNGSNYSPTVIGYDDGRLMYGDANCWAESSYTIIEFSEVIADYEQSQKSNGKIIGYKVPFDLFGGDIKKGSVYTILEGHRVYCVKYDNDTKAHCIPSEIVETWEPMYEEEKELVSSFADVIKIAKIGNNDNIVHFGSGYISITVKNRQFAVTKDNFDFTTEFEKELKELGIKID